MRFYPTECSECEEEVAVEWAEDGQQLSDLCDCGWTVCINCWEQHKCKDIQ